MPSGLNLDARPGPDGFSIRIYAISPDYPKAVAFNQGSLEVLMYDGEGSVAKPLRTWKFTPEELRAYASVSPFGVSYEMVLAWEKAVPTGKNISIQARYVPETGNPVVSAPASIVVADKHSK
jgi:hypothetical protein